jgi:hypothetical protein
MDIEIKDCGDFVGYCHLYHQQYIIDQQIDHAEYTNRLGWIDFENNFTKYADELAKDEYNNGIVLTAKEVLDNPPA